MRAAIAVFRAGRLELAGPVDWPDGTKVDVIPMNQPQRQSWLALPPLDVGQFVELTNEDDLLAEMLDDSRN